MYIYLIYVYIYISQTCRSLPISVSRPLYINVYVHTYMHTNKTIYRDVWARPCQAEAHGIVGLPPVALPLGGCLSCSTFAA